MRRSCSRRSPASIPRDAVTTASAGEGAGRDYTRVPRPERPRGRAHRRRRARALRATARPPIAIVEAALDEHEAARGRDRRPGGHRDRLGQTSGTSEFEVLLYEFKADLNAYLAALGPGARCRRWPTLIAFNEENRDREMPYFGQEHLRPGAGEGPAHRRRPTATRSPRTGASRARRGSTRSMDAAPARRARRPDRRPGLARSTSSTATTASGGSSTPAGGRRLSAHHRAGRATSAACRSGISFFGRAWSEPTLIRLAYAFEQATKHRRPPRFLPTADLTLERLRAMLLGLRSVILHVDDRRQGEGLVREGPRVRALLLRAVLRGLQRGRLRARARPRPGGR